MDPDAALDRLRSAVKAGDRAAAFEAAADVMEWSERKGFDPIHMTDEDREIIKTLVAEVPKCPDGGTCHHNCEKECWRVQNCAPLSGVFPGDRWPEALLSRRTDVEAPREFRRAVGLVAYLNTFTGEVRLYVQGAEPLADLALEEASHWRNEGPVLLLRNDPVPSAPEEPE